MRVEVTGLRELVRGHAERALSRTCVRASHPPTLALTLSPRPRSLNPQFLTPPLSLSLPLDLFLSLSLGRSARACITR